MYTMYKKRMETGAEFMWVLTDNRTNAGCGVYMLKDVSYQHRRVEIGGVWVGAKARRSKANLVTTYHPYVYGYFMRG